MVCAIQLEFEFPNVMIVFEIVIFVYFSLCVLCQNDEFKDTNKVFYVSGAVQLGEQLVPAFQRAVFRQSTPPSQPYSPNYLLGPTISDNRDRVRSFPTGVPSYDTNRQTDVIVGRNVGNSVGVHDVRGIVLSHSRNRPRPKLSETNKFGSELRRPSNQLHRLQNQFFRPSQLITPLVSSANSQFQSLNENSRNHLEASQFQRSSIRTPTVGFRPVVRQSITDRDNEHRETSSNFVDNQSRDSLFGSKTWIELKRNETDKFYPYVRHDPLTFQIPEPIASEVSKQVDSTSYRTPDNVENAEDYIRNSASHILTPVSSVSSLGKSHTENDNAQHFHTSHITPSKKRTSTPLSDTNIFSSATHIPLLLTGINNRSLVRNQHSIKDVSLEAPPNILRKNKINVVQNDKATRPVLSSIEDGEKTKSNNQLGGFDYERDNPTHRLEHAAQLLSESKSRIYDNEGAREISSGDDYSITGDIVPSSSYEIPSSTPFYDYYEYYYYDLQNPNSSTLDYENLDESSSVTLSYGDELENPKNEHINSENNTLLSQSRNTSYSSQNNTSYANLQAIKSTNKAIVQTQLNTNQTTSKKIPSITTQPQDKGLNSDEIKHLINYKTTSYNINNYANLSKSENSSSQKHPRLRNRLASLLKQQLNVFTDDPRVVITESSVNIAQKHNEEVSMTTENVTFQPKNETPVNLIDSTENDYLTTVTSIESASANTNYSAAEPNTAQSSTPAKYALSIALNRGVNNPVSHRPTSARPNQQAGLFSLFEKLRHQKTQNVKEVIASVRKGKELTISSKRRLATRRPVLSSLSQYKNSVAVSLNGSITNSSEPDLDVDSMTFITTTPTSLHQQHKAFVSSGGIYNQLAHIIATFPSGFRIQSVQSTSNQGNHSPSISSSQSTVSPVILSEKVHDRGELTDDILIGFENDLNVLETTSEKGLDIHTTKILADNAHKSEKSINANNTVYLKSVSNTKMENISFAGKNHQEESIGASSASLPVGIVTSSPDTTKTPSTLNNKEKRVSFDKPLQNSSEAIEKPTGAVSIVTTQPPTSIVKTPALFKGFSTTSVTNLQSLKDSILDTTSYPVSTTHKPTSTPSQTGLSEKKGVVDTSRNGYYNRSDAKEQNLSTQCSNRCVLRGTLRIVRGLSWRDQLSSPNTQTWQTAARVVTQQLTEAFTASSLAVWFDRIQVVSFSRGSVVVEYLVYFNNLAGRLTTRDVLRLFQQDLRTLATPTSATRLPDNGTGELRRLGQLAIDATYTNFYVEDSSDVRLVSDVLSDGALTSDAEVSSSYLIPEWLIAAIVVGLTAMLFMMVFGVLVLWSRRKRGRLRSTVPLTIDVLDHLEKAGRMKGTESGIGRVPTMPAIIDPYVDDGDDAWDDSKVSRRQYRRTLLTAGESTFEPSLGESVYDSWGSDCSVAGRRPRVLRAAHTGVPETDSDEF